jgi:hypothetical protein
MKTTGLIRDDCPNCGYPSYENGFCHKCGRYRKGLDKDKMPKVKDLYELMTSDGGLFVEEEDE